MAEGGQAEHSAFAARFDALFRSRKQPGTDWAWTTRALAEALSERGHPISHTTIGRLRRGETDPRQGDVEALADVLGVPVSYFFSAAGDGDGRPAQDEQRVLDAMAASPHVRAIAMRLAEDGPISEDVAAAIMNIIEQVRGLDRRGSQGRAAQGRRRRSGAGSTGD